MVLTHSEQDKVIRLVLLKAATERFDGYYCIPIAPNITIVYNSVENKVWVKSDMITSSNRSVVLFFINKLIGHEAFR